MAAQFDAGQYGFFGGAPPSEAEVVLSELEAAGSGSGAGEAGDKAVDAPAPTRAR